MAGMGALVGQNLVQLVAGVGVGADEYPAEEREGAFCAGQEVYGGAVYLLRGAAACQADDASQLEKEAQGQQGGHEPVGEDDAVGHQLPPVRFGLRRQGQFGQHHGGVEVGHGCHRLLLHNPLLDVEQRHGGRYGEEAEQGRPPPGEERVLVEEQPIEGVEQGYRHVDFQKIDHIFQLKMKN